MEQVLSKKETLASLIVQGCDERIELIHDGANKYHVNPLNFEGTINRGSCTSCTFTPASYQACLSFLDEMNKVPFETLHKEQEQTLKTLIGGGEMANFEVFFAPSGSYLCYFPLLFSQIINPEKPIYSILTCAEELGSGSKTASSGAFFTHKNQFNEAVPFEKSISEHLDVTIKAFQARTADGKIYNPEAEVLSEIKQSVNDYNVIANIVLGSKSGIADNISMIEKAPKDVLWVVDLCQMRASKRLIRKLLNLNCVVMITGSKFYQAPPFCGALLVPHELTKRFKTYSEKHIAPFKHLFSQYDIPHQLTELRQEFEPFENKGLMLRWQAALHEMKLLQDYGIETVMDGVDRWNQAVTDRLELHSDTFTLMPDTERTNNSIISFRVKRNGTYLTHEELKEVHSSILRSKHPQLKNHDKVLIGQPVAYGDKSFLRLAIGSFGTRMLIENDFDLSNDLAIVEIIRAYSKELAINS